MTSLNSNIDRIVKPLKMLNNGSHTLDEILQAGRVTGDNSGLRFNEKKEPNLEEPSSDPTHANSKPKMSNQMSKHHGKKGHHGTHQGESPALEMSSLWKAWSYKALLFQVVWLP